MSAPIIEVSGLSKQYRIGTKAPYKTLRETLMHTITSPARLLNSSKSENNTIWALKDVSFEVQEGEVLGIIGRNGAGKSTLLKILSRVTEPTEGTVRLRGRVSSLLEVGTGFHPELTGRENIFLNGSILGMSRREIKSKFDEMVAFAEVEKFIDTPVKRYSSGMYVRLAFAVAAHLEPEILIVDEVLAVGDISFQKKCLGKIGDVAKGGRTVLFVSHNMSAIRTLCEKAIWIDYGQIVKKGSADEIVRSYEESQIMRLDDSATIVDRNREYVKNKKFYIKRVEMTNPAGELKNIFKYNGKLILSVELSGECPDNSYGLEFRIYKESGDYAAVGTSGPLHGIYFNRKVKRIKVDIGPLILTNGKYTIALSTISEGWIRTDNWEDACSFNIIECHPFALPQEIKTPVCVIQHSFFKEEI